MRGEANISKTTRAELQRLEISNQLVDQARLLGDGQRALRVQIDQMRHTAKSLRKPLNVEKIKAMEREIRMMDSTRKQALRDASQSMKSPANKVVGDAVKWAAISVGITASINIIRQVASGEGVDLGKALNFMAQPSFWGGTAGGFLGSMLASSLAASLMPPGVGIFLRVLPGFLGAALGFDVGSSLFGGEMDLLGTMVTTLASAGGYSIAASFFTAPLALIGAAIAAGSLAGFVLDKLRGDGPAAEGYVLPESPVDMDLLADTALASVTPADAVNAAAARSSITATNLATAQAQRDQAYNAYIGYMNKRNIPEATIAHKAYMDAEEQLKLAKQNAR